MSDVAPGVPATEPDMSQPELSAVDPAPAEPVAVEQQTASNAPAPEVVPAEKEPADVNYAAATLLAFVDEGRKPGDAELDEAREDLRAALDAADAQ